MEIYIIKQGDTLWQIANRYGVSYQRLMSDNGITNPNALVVGQAILILFPKQVHTVQRGDSLFSIARMYGVSVMNLLQNNPSLALNQSIYEGQQLTVSFDTQKGKPITVNGYAYPNISRSILRRALPYLTNLIIFGYGFTEEGDLLNIPDDELIMISRQYNTAPIMLLSTIDSSGGFSTDLATVLFKSEEMQNKLLNQVLQKMRQKGYMGLEIDFEYVSPADKEPFISFLQKAADLMHNNGYELTVALAPKTSANQQGLLYEAHDYRRIGEIADRVMLMTYEWGYTYGPPMAVSPLDKVRQVIEYAVSDIPREKIIMGIPNYGYDWALPFKQNETVAVTVGNEYAITLAAQNGAQIEFDEKAYTPYFNYYSRTGKPHIVWFEDARSIDGKLDLANEFDLHGVGYWNIMRPFSQNFMLLAAKNEIIKNI